MFANFEKAFFKKNEMDDKIPVEVLESLGEKKKLPSGLGYVDVGHGACVITPEASEMTLKGLRVDLPDDLPEGFHPSTISELMEFMYRTQRKIKITPNEDKLVALNGAKVNINDLVQFPLKNASLDEYEMFISPEPFEPPFNITLEGNNVIKQFTIQRQPYADMHKSLFKSIDSPSFEISYILDEREHRLQFNFKLNIGLAQDSTEVIQALKLYEACVQKDLKLQGHPFPKDSVNDTEKKSIIETLKFWEKIVVLEKVIGVAFVPTSKPELKDVFFIEKLYRCLVENEPFKEYVNINNFTLNVSPEFNGDELLSKDGISFQYGNHDHVKVFGVDIDVYNVVGLFDFRVTHLEAVDYQKSKYQLFVEPLEGKRIYQSTFIFLEEEQAIKYMTNVTENNGLTELQHAEEIPLRR